MERKRILIIGGTGTIGQEMLTRWADLHDLTVIGRSNHKKERLSSCYPQVQFHLCDVCHLQSIRRIFRDKDIIIHAAAIKNVGIGQDDLDELWRVNLNGTYHVAKLYEGLAGDAVGIFLSSDKACQPTNAYGATKFMGEQLCRQVGMKVLRYGNVVGSEGSFVPIWKQAIAEGRSIIARDATRFFLTPYRAVNLISDAIDAEGWLFIPRNLKAFQILNLARYVAGEKVIIQDLQSGEKQHEQLLSVSEKVVGATELLSKVEWGLNQNLNLYFSNTVEMMPPEEVLRKIGWKI